MSRSGICHSLCQLTLGILILGLVAGSSSAQTRDQAGPPSPLPTSTPPVGSSERRLPPRHEMPPVRVEPEVLDFGDVTPGTKIPGNFQLTNESDEPLNILTALSTCWCTVAQPNDRILEPGETIQLPVTFEAGDYLGVQDRDVMVRFEGYSKTLRCRLRADINNGVRLAVEYDPPGQMRQGIATLTSTSDEVFHVLSVSGSPPEFADGFNPANDEPRSTYRVRFNAGSAPPELLPQFIAIELDHPDSSVIDFPVPEYEPKRRLRPWSFFERALRLNTVFEGDVREFTVTMERVTANPLDLIESIRIYPDLVDLRIMGMSAEGDKLKLRLHISPKPGVRGLINAEAVFIASDHDESLTILGRVANEADTAREPEPVQAP